MFKESIVAPEGFSRWLVPPAAVATHLCIGSVYAWSMFNEPLSRELGVVAAAADDWALSSVVPVFSTSIVFLGLSAAVAGRWLEDVGPRLVGAVSACCWGGGFLVGAAGLHFHSLPLLYLGYGVLGGAGLGLGYVSPVSTLLRWFPDRRGMATGMAIMGFGGGAMLAAPAKKALLSKFFVAPEYLGPASEAVLRTDAATGRRQALWDRGGDGAAEWVEVVVANAKDLALAGADGLSEGVYVVGTGSTGAAMTFVALGSVYFATIMAGACSYRVPREGWAPLGYNAAGEEGTVAPSAGPDVKEAELHSARSRPIPGSPSDRPASIADTVGKHARSPPSAGSTAAVPAGTWSLFSAGVTREDVHIDQALKTPQFYQLWTCLFCNVTAGIGVIGVAKTMVTDIFGSTMPGTVDAAFAASYVGAIGVANMVGRFVWASSSDVLGRKNTYHAYFGLGIPLYLSVPFAAEWAGAVQGGSAAPLALFCGSTMLIFTMYGGGFSTIPAYLADVFGEKHVGGIHGRLLTAWASAGVAGPVIVTSLRRRSSDEAIQRVADAVPAADFERAFGAGKDQLQALADAKTVTLSRLVEIAPPGTIDPTCTLYNDTMFTMAGILGVALLSNSMIKPVHPKHWMAKEDSAVEVR
jgi:MFS family permease